MQANAAIKIFLVHKDTDLSYQFPQQLPIMFLITPGYSEQEIPAPIVEFIVLQ